MARSKAPQGQLNLGSLFDAAAFEERTQHLPTTLEEGVPIYAALLKEFHAAVMRGDNAASKAAHEQAEDLAIRLNGGRFGYLRDSDAPGNALMHRTAAPKGQVPIWGQEGDFIVAVRGTRVRIDFAGMFGIAFPSFCTHAVDWEKPFISATGYRSFLGYSYDWERRILPAAFVTECIEDHLEGEIRGKLVPIEPRYREQHGQEATAPPSADPR